MIKGEMKNELNEPKKVLKSIKTDNLDNIRSYIEKNKLKTEFEFKNIRQTISSLDDLIKCIDVSKEVIDEWKK